MNSVVSTPSHREIWLTWDWTKQDVQLAKEKNLSRQRINQIRELLGKPKAALHNQCLARKVNRQKAAEFLEANENKIEHLSITEIATALNIPYSAVYKEITVRGLNTRKTRTSPFHLFNWGLPNDVLGKTWGLKTSYVANRRKFFFNQVESLDAEVLSLSDNQQSLDAQINEEKKKARDWKKFMKQVLVNEKRNGALAP